VLNGVIICKDGKLALVRLLLPDGQWLCSQECILFCI
jgi:hypothetical protein